jgi:cobalamin biosynthesis Mg chelatase CobN
MDNDQIKQQIESAKRAFVASKTQPSQDSMAGDTLTNGDRFTETKTQKDILARVSSLMTEASQTRRTNPLSEDGNTEPPRPFWAQSQTDLSSFEKWERQQNKMNSDDTAESTREVPPLATTSETHPSPTKDDTDIALSAIRDEVIGRIDNGSKPENDAKILELTEKTQQLEARIDKHHQDIAALLQLVRQKQNTVEERILSQVATKKPSSTAGLVFFIMLLFVIAIVGWLYWMNPVLMTNLAMIVVNKTFTMIMNIVSLVGLV